MYLHLGQDIVIRLSDIVGIFDIENSTIRRSSKDFLSAAQKGGRVVSVSQELPKSFIVCEQGGTSMVYLSQISSTTLKKRASFLKDSPTLEL